MADTVTVYHPTAIGPNGDVVAYEIPKDLLERHVEQGWLKSEPKNAAVTAAKKATEKAHAAAVAEATKPAEG